MGARSSTPEEYKAKIKEAIEKSYFLSETSLCELGVAKGGKVRDIYETDSDIVMLASDRVSAFDYILPNLIPFKGSVLNAMTRFQMAQTQDIIPNALRDVQVDPNVVIQKKMKVIKVEAIVRGYVWGSMAAAFERGERTFCGLTMPDSLIRFQKFESPIFTPTTKADQGEHDADMTFDQVVETCGSKEMAEKVRDTALALFARGSELAAKRGLILIDTKYEFGLDEKGELHVIDEVNTPDSSRLCERSEYTDKFPKIQKEMKTGKYAHVSALLEAKPELKIKELSKQYVRDVLLASGFDPKKGGEVPVMSEEQVIECVYRYITVYERVTGTQFQFPDLSIRPETRLLARLSGQGILKGGCCLSVDGALKSQLQTAGISFQSVSSTEMGKLKEAVKYHNTSLTPVVVLVPSSEVLEKVARLSRNPVVVSEDESTMSLVKQIFATGGGATPFFKEALALSE
uniref:phosphoribosylaminoimidazolesuccinocarboxamide synthase n=1 Tax=Chromera velia CCMP2878 TaxID=1169474 RepID=A0A0G4EZM1_9ALVE|eukprot:Cvel_14238.t1-p1 / transcript=Cvel_14238.t1 / gene=Cvel_14238 / organism=Chromera_velia_CCMP2878 / gene_product=Phosphoribosylaminoimidazole-succinocarboxamide, putative / transcript_product=Phosphoribosylaminoimidazole-succinocarboxamide, putative / location=Cvel_scaffold1005:6457-10324(+) / protein_length=458 / sequence_SO=supercontig / SO=protein_coding / is_pseudo=false